MNPNHPIKLSRPVQRAWLGRALRRTSMTLPSGKVVGYEFTEPTAIDTRLGRLTFLGYRQGGTTTPELTFTCAGVAMPVRLHNPAPQLHWHVLRTVCTPDDLL